MNRIIKRIAKATAPPALPPALALRKVTSKTGKGVYASTDSLFKGAVFGRDSLEVAEDLMKIRPTLVRSILLTLASLQGVVDNPTNEEEPGKIIHEFRSMKVDGKSIDGLQLFIFNELTSRRGREGNTMTYYGSIDATPLFIKVLATYVNLYGPSILLKIVRQRSGFRVSLQDSLTMAVDWLATKLAGSTTGLLEYQRRNPYGIENQVWKDSREFYVHENGKLVNFSQAIASIEVQGQVYDALMLAADLLPSRADELKEQAAKVRQQTLKFLWQPSRHYFALGIDHQTNGKLRIIETQTANPAALLDSHIFDGLKSKDRQKYVSGIVRNIMGSEFLTDAGIRSRGLSEGHLIKFWDYHGSFTSWPKETYDIAKGLRRQGFPNLAHQLENRLLNIVRKSRNYPEFVYIDFRGRVLASPPSAHAHAGMMLVDSTNEPEAIQAWTVSAVLAIVSHRIPGRRHTKIKQQSWQADLEKEVLAHVPQVRNLLLWRELSARYPDYDYSLTTHRRQQFGDFSGYKSDKPESKV